jgi:hypothetical protein
MSVFHRPALAAVCLIATACTATEAPPAETAEPAFTTEITTRYPAAERLVALGDVHGDIEAMRAALSLAGVIDDDDDWIGGETVVVQTGDLLDRGDDEQDIVDMMKDLQTQAADAGGALHLLNGNHELMNVALDFGYVTAGGFADFEDAPGVDANDPAVHHFDHDERARAHAFMPGGAYATKLATHPVVLIVGDTAFAHGGVLPSYADEVESVNREVADWFLGNDDTGYRIYEDDDSPVWSRHYSMNTSSSDCDLLDEALEVLGVERMVVGHTVQDIITSACNDKVWRVDVGMAAHYGGSPQVLELTEDAIYVLY